MKPNTRRIILTIVRVVLGILFLFSGIGKLINGADARYLVELLATEFYWLIEYSSSIVIVTSFLELLLAGFLLWGRHLKWTLAGTLLLLTGFTSVLAFFYSQGMSVESCGCFGAFGFASGIEVTLLRNIILITVILGTFLLLRNISKKAEPELSS